MKRNTALRECVPSGTGVDIGFDTEEMVLFSRTFHVFFKCENLRLLTYLQFSLVSVVISLYLVDENEKLSFLYLNKKTLRFILTICDLLKTQPNDINCCWK